MERLQKIISQAGITSRRKAEQLILEGKVTVNGEIVKELGVKSDPGKDDIRINGEQIFIDKERIVIIFNKPTKVITSMNDPQNRKKVIDFINISERVYPVGRLDFETEGLLVLTNDGDLAYRLMHPKYGIEKTYEVIVNSVPNENDINKLRTGIMLKDGITLPAKVRIVERLSDRRTKLSITIHEGRNRQVRKMCKAVNLEIESLKRISYGFLTLDGLAVGEYRFLSNKEIEKLKNFI
ncbi:MAG: pseudouridine synthase [Vulcanibacillus sp.]